MSRRSPALLLLVVVATLLGACAGMDTTSDLTPVAIDDFKMVAGKWEGLASGVSARHDDWVEVTITPDGKYDFGIHRTIGVLGGAGTFTLSGGKLQSRSDKGSATYTLYQGGAKRVLQVQGVLSDGRPLTARLTARE
jgi:hypothetical protein